MSFYQSLLADASFFGLLREIDLDLAEQVRASGCACGGVLHSARYRRKPRGGPACLPRDCSVRESFCCAEEGCRRRSTPASVRFLGRRVFFSVVVLLVPIVRDGLTPRRFERLAEELAVSRRTLQRWRRWWREAFPLTQPGRVAASQMLLLDSQQLPRSLLSAFGSGSEGVLQALRWLATSEAGGHGR